MLFLSDSEKIKRKKLEELTWCRVNNHQVHRKSTWINVCNMVNTTPVEAQYTDARHIEETGTIYASVKQLQKHWFPIREAPRIYLYMYANIANNYYAISHSVFCILYQSDNQFDHNVTK